MAPIEQLLRDAWMAGFEDGRGYSPDVSPEDLFDAYMENFCETLGGDGDD